MNLVKEAKWDGTAAAKRVSTNETKKKKFIPTVAIVIPLFFSSGALSISSKAIALAFPSSAST